MAKGQQSLESPSAITRRLRGQSSIELLVLLAAFFAFLAAWVPVINGVRQASAESMEQKYAELALSDLVGAGDEAYILGSGNAREVEVRLLGDASVGFDAESRNATIFFLNGTRNVSARTQFSTAGNGIVLAGGLNRVLVRSEDGKVVFERLG